MSAEKQKKADFVIMGRVGCETCVSYYPCPSCGDVICLSQDSLLSEVEEKPCGEWEPQ